MDGSVPTVDRLFRDAVRLLNEGELAGAENLFREALQRVPESAAVRANLALLLQRAGRAQEAERYYRDALGREPDNAQIHLNFGVLLAAQRRPVEAELAYRRALAVCPQLPAAWSNLGVLLACLKREHEAEQCYRSALRIAPDYRAASYNLSYLLLRQGRFEEGWERFEARNWQSPLAAWLACPRWNGDALDGKSLLVGFEAGHGDMIQFCRYLPWLKQRGAQRVTLVCQPGLKRLFARLAGVDEVLPYGEPLSLQDYECWTTPMSLSFLFGTRLDTIPPGLPYLSVDPAALRHAHEMLGTREPGLHVGLAWKGNPLFENDAERSLPSLAPLAPLADLKGIRFYSLQKEPGDDEAYAANAAFPLHDLGPLLNDYYDTAAVILNLDLVISVDTAVAHLAGALNKRCWVLLPDFNTDWRWLAARNDSPWYPGVMRLFRQKSDRQWSTIVDEIRQALRQLLDS